MYIRASTRNLPLAELKIDGRRFRKSRNVGGDARERRKLAEPICINLSMSTSCVGFFFFVSRTINL